MLPWYKHIYHCIHHIIITPYLYLVATRAISEDEEVFVDYNYNTVAELVQKADTECKGASRILAKITKNNYWIQHKLKDG